MTQLMRYKVSEENEDLDNSISHSTEAILLPFDPQIEFSPNLKLPIDIEHCIKYLRYLRDQLLETSDVTHSDITTYLVQALAIRAELESVNRMRDIKEMAILCHELLTMDVSEALMIDTIKVLVNAIKPIVASRQAPPDEAIECLCAYIRMPNLEGVSVVLAMSLAFRFQRTHSLDDYEEAMSIMNKIIANPSQDVELVPLVMGLAGSLAHSRFLSYRKPAHLEEAIFLARADLSAMSLESPRRGPATENLAFLENVRFNEFGVTSDRQEKMGAHLATSPQMPKSNNEINEDTHAQALRFMLDITDLAEIEKAIEYCRCSLTSPHSMAPSTLFVLGQLLGRAFDRTDNINHLNESIAVYRDAFKMPGIQLIARHTIILSLISSLLSRFSLYENREDWDEILQLFPIVAADANANIADQLKISFQWTRFARSSRHPSTPTAYESAISLMQEYLTFAPTLEIQHFRLVAIRDECETLPLNYASYQVRTGLLEQAIETLERGRGLLLSEMRGLRFPLDQLRAVNLPLTEKFQAVNRDLEALTTSGSPSDCINDGQVNSGKEMDQFGRLVVKQQRLVEERNGLISRIKSLPGFDTFLKPPSFDTLRSAAAGGPVIIINHSEWGSDIIILLHNSPPSLIPTANDFYDSAIRLKDKLLAARNEGLEAKEYEDALCYVLEKVYDLVGRPVIQRLHQLNVPEQSRVWWCPTSVFLSTPWARRHLSPQLERLKHHRFAHISSHGILEMGKPFDAFFKLYKGTRLTLLDIVRSRLPTAEFAFLSACHTAEITEESIANEGLHLAAAVQYSGFRSVIGTMWAMADIDGPAVAGSFYRLTFSDRWQGGPYYERTAEGLRDAVRDLRRRRNMTLERWVNLVHYGA
ncbi:hypothetical protein BJV74DRAFT_795916 [Russula compacta]|nr:hypothetical protein BJV74DRAFT_795916 [Russula compacta]